MQQAPPSQPKPRSTTFHILVAGTVWVVIKSFALLSPIVLSLLLILLTSLAVNPVISRLREWTGGRKGATALVAVALAAMIGMTGWAFLGPMKSSMTELAEKAPAYWERLQKPLIKIEQQAERSEEKLQAEVATEIIGESAASGEPAVLKAPPPATKPEPESKPIRSGLSDLFQAIAGSFTDALAQGLIAGVLEAVPFLGPILSAIPALLLALSKGGMTPLWVLLAYVLIQALEGNVIMPMVMARGMKLHPLAVIFSMLLCVATFGVLGVLVAAPLVAIVGILHDELYRKHFLPSTTDSDLDRLSRRALYENLPEDR